MPRQILPALTVDDAKFREQLVLSLAELPREPKGFSLTYLHRNIAAWIDKPVFLGHLHALERANMVQLLESGRGVIVRPVDASLSSSADAIPIPAPVIERRIWWRIIACIARRGGSLTMPRLVRAFGGSIKAHELDVHVRWLVEQGHLIERVDPSEGGAVYSLASGEPRTLTVAGQISET